MTNLSISRAWEEAKAVLGREGKLISSVALALIVLPQTIASAIAPPPVLSSAAPPDWMPVVSILVALLGITGQIAIARLALGPSTIVGDAIAHGFRRVIPAFLALFILFLAIGIVLFPVMLMLAGAEGVQSLAASRPTSAAAGAILLVFVAALFAAPRFQLIVPTASAEPGGPIRLLQRSWRMTEGNYWRLLGFLLLILIAAIVILFTGQIIVGLVAKAAFGTADPFSVGAVVAGLFMAMLAAAFAAVSTVILARIYTQLARGDDAAEVFR